MSWYRPHLEPSLALIERSTNDRSARIIDVGGGESTLVDDLLARGFQNVTVLVEYGFAEPDFTVRADPDAVLAVLDRL